MVNAKMKELLKEIAIEISIQKIVYNNLNIIQEVEEELTNQIESVETEWNNNKPISFRNEEYINKLSNSNNLSQSSIKNNISNNLSQSIIKNNILKSSFLSDSPSFNNSRDLNVIKYHKNRGDLSQINNPIVIQFSGNPITYSLCYSLEVKWIYKSLNITSVTESSNNKKRVYYTYSIQMKLDDTSKEGSIQLIPYTTNNQIIGEPININIIKK